MEFLAKLKLDGENARDLTERSQLALQTVHAP